jgi:hypothetical protein
MEYGRIALSKEGVFGGRSDFSGNRMIVGHSANFADKNGTCGRAGQRSGLIALKIQLGLD